METLTGTYRQIATFVTWAPTKPVYTYYSNVGNISYYLFWNSLDYWCLGLFESLEGGGVYACSRTDMTEPWHRKWRPIIDNMTVDVTCAAAPSVNVECPRVNLKSTKFGSRVNGEYHQITLQVPWAKEKPVYEYYNTQENQSYFIFWLIKEKWSLGRRDGLTRGMYMIESSLNETEPTGIWKSHKVNVTCVNQSIPHSHCTRIRLYDPINSTVSGTYAQLAFKMRGAPEKPVYAYYNELSTNNYFIFWSETKQWCLSATKELLPNHHKVIYCAVKDQSNVSEPWLARWKQNNTVVSVTGEVCRLPNPPEVKCPLLRVVIQGDQRVSGVYRQVALIGDFPKPTYIYQSSITDEKYVLTWRYNHWCIEKFDRSDPECFAKSEGGNESLEPWQGMWGSNEVSCADFMPILQCIHLNVSIKGSLEGSGIYKQTAMTVRWAEEKPVYEYYTNIWEKSYFMFFTSDAKWAIGTRENLYNYGAPHESYLAKSEQGLPEPWYLGSNWKDCNVSCVDFDVSKSSASFMVQCPRLNVTVRNRKEFTGTYSHIALHSSWDPHKPVYEFYNKQNRTSYFIFWLIHEKWCLGLREGLTKGGHYACGNVDASEPWQTAWRPKNFNETVTVTCIR